MDCPICKQPMKKGVVPSGNTALRWYGGGGEVRLSKPSLICPEAEAFYCPDCRHVIIPVPEIEDFFDKLDRKLDEVKEKFTAARDELAEQREEKQAEKEKKKREGKDPWEL